jgi:hypothetical protein
VTEENHETFCIADVPAKIESKHLQNQSLRNSGHENQVVIIQELINTSIQIKNIRIHYYIDTLGNYFETDE